jgi:hypothetical protein
MISFFSFRLSDKLWAGLSFTPDHLRSKVQSCIIATYVAVANSLPEALQQPPHLPYQQTLHNNSHLT